MPVIGRNTPTHLAVFTGKIAKKLEAIDHPILTEVPDPPEWLTCPAAIEEWRRLTPLLVEARLLDEPSLTSLANLCAAQGVIQEMLLSNEMNASLLNYHRALANDFGLSPLARTRIGRPAEGGDAANPFANNGVKKKASRRR